MASREEYLPTLTWFFEQVDKKLGSPKNLPKAHWSDATPETLFRMMQKEIDELTVELEGHYFKELGNDDGHIFISSDAVIKECADVAAFAMMIADRMRELGDTSY